MNPAHRLILFLRGHESVSYEMVPAALPLQGPGCRPVKPASAPLVLVPSSGCKGPFPVSRPARTVGRHGHPEDLEFLIGMQRISHYLVENALSCFFVTVCVSVSAQNATGDGPSPRPYARQTGAPRRALSVAPHVAPPHPLLLFVNYFLINLLAPSRLHTVD